MLLFVLVAVFCSQATGRPLIDSTLNITEVQWSPEKTGVFLGTPSILRTCAGTNATLTPCPILVSYEEFHNGPEPVCAPGVLPPPSGAVLSDADFEAPDVMEPLTTYPVTNVYRSDDEGVTWYKLGASNNTHFATLWERAGDDNVYLVGTGVGGVRVSRSGDGGRTWTSATVISGAFASGATPVLTANGRIYRAVEATIGPKGWPSEFAATVASAPANASDLLDASLWTLAKPALWNDSWVGPQWAAHNFTKPGYLEGNAVLGKDGNVYDMLRVNSLPWANVAVLMKLNGEGLTFERMMPFPGGMSKFTVHHDPVSDMYVSLSNNVTHWWCPSERNTLTLTVSPDLETWEAVTVLLADDTGFLVTDSSRYTGFHYVDWHFDGDDVIAAVRTAYRGAVSYHNSNRITFLRVVNFRQYL